VVSLCGESARAEYRGHAAGVTMSDDALLPSYRLQSAWSLALRGVQPLFGDDSDDAYGRYRYRYSPVFSSFHYFLGGVNIVTIVTIERIESPMIQ